MSDKEKQKEKRKVSPRRRALIRTLEVIFVVLIVAYVAVYTLRPSGAKFVFIAQDDEGLTQIWIAGINDAKNPRQLSHDPDEFVIPESMRTGENQTVVYQTRRNSRSAPVSLWMIDTQNGQSERLLECTEPLSCENALIRSDGEWIAYEEYTRLDEPAGDSSEYYHLSVVVQNVSTQERWIVYETDLWRSEYNPRFVLEWIADTGQLAYLAYPDSVDVDGEIELRYYSVEENVTMNSTIWYGMTTTSYFSPDGSRYVVESNRMAYAENIILSHEMSPSSVYGRAINFDYDGRLHASYFLDWYGNNTTILISNTWTSYAEENNPIVYFDLSTYNTRIDDLHALQRNVDGFVYVEADLSADDSRIIARKFNNSTHEYYIVVYDIEANEETILPVYGTNPQWVNGGR